MDSFLPTKHFHSFQWPQNSSGRHILRTVLPGHDSELEWSWRLSLRWLQGQGLSVCSLTLSRERRAAAAPERMQELEVGRSELVGGPQLLCSAPRARRLTGEKAGQTVLCAWDMQTCCLCLLGNAWLWCLLCCSPGLLDRGTKQTPQGLSGSLSVPCRSHT